MSEVVTLMIFVSGLTFWGFFKTSPKHPNQKAVSIYNKMIVGVCLMMSVTWYFFARTWFVNMAREKYIALFGVAGACALATVILVVFALIRNFYIFKSQNNRPGRWR